MSKRNGRAWEIRLLVAIMGLVAALVQPATLDAQPSTVSQPESPRFLLKNGTTSFLDPIAPSFNLAAEYRLAGRFYGHAEGGPLLPFRYFNEPTTEYLRGFRLRTALRYYMRPPQKGMHATYLELLYTYQNTDARIEGDFLRETPAGTFGQRLLYDFRQQKHGGYLNAGIQQVFVGGFLFETGVGMGPLFRNHQYGKVPPDARFHTNGSFIWEYGGREQERFITFMLYINLGYAF